MARGKVVDRAMVDLVLQMKARNEKLTTEQIGAVVQCDSTTAGRIIRCGSWEAFCDWKEEKARKEREKNRKTSTVKLVYDKSILEEYRQEQEAKAEEQLPGQISMELETKQEMSDQTKLMRFQASQVDKLIIKLDKLNDTLSMILRAVRKE